MEEEEGRYKKNIYTKMNKHEKHIGFMKIIGNCHKFRVQLRNQQIFTQIPRFIQIFLICRNALEIL